MSTYLTTEELAHLIKYDQRTIRERLKDSILLEGIHYIRPFGRRKVLYIWEKVEADMRVASCEESQFMPIANVSVNHHG